MQADDISRVLGRYVQERTGAGQVQVLEFTRLSGGAIQSNYALTVQCVGGSLPGRLALVVRSDSPSQVAISLTRDHEFRVMQVAYAAGVSVPEPLWFCADLSLIGQAFSVMRRVPGTASGRELVRGALKPQQAQALTQQLGRELACLHKVRPPHDKLPFLAAPTVSPALARVAQYRSALDAISDAHPTLEWSLNWLEDQAPASHDVVLCHGDYRTGNYMVHEGRISGILDWEFSGWSDPYEDLGWLCSRSWRFGARRNPVGGVGRKEDLFQAYEAVAGRKIAPEKVLYWEIMGMTRWAIIALQQAQRHLSGQETSLELALTGRLLPEIEFDILDQIQYMEAA
ncbi:phosphotransferase family protein [Pollutimonas thiosulfatoxidans]|uniref:Phosphotransferase family protein n=1 Tax=Pollutimonas thiosulfatoxidans TaxID=2028345 RepID=A0A410G922_9BURK|nr:phosphotransferase family protein [Pollutimonas thiosulfatoxidans]QAA92705.1 phosphotransferase family protein [Pollutimonas thiosulfatoxidans]